MAQTITLPQKTLTDILTRLDDLTKEVKAIRMRLFEEEPSYGSDAWWDWSTEKGVEDIKAGRYTVVRNKKELKAHLDSLKRS